jgi:uncharacterized membrane protein
MRQDPVAAQFFLPWAKVGMARIQLALTPLLFIIIGIGVGVPIWAQMMANKRSPNQTRDEPVSPSEFKSDNETEWSNPRNWTGPKWLSLYFSKRDSRIWVPKQIPSMGWTVNLGNPRGALILMTIILMIIAFLIMMLARIGS